MFLLNELEPEGLLYADFACGLSPYRSMLWGDRSYWLWLKAAGVPIALFRAENAPPLSLWPMIIPSW